MEMLFRCGASDERKLSDSSVASRLLDRPPVRGSFGLRLIGDVTHPGDVDHPVLLVGFELTQLERFAS
jgi:hypothetical protein